jgi:hypothetical protein
MRAAAILALAAMLAPDGAVADVKRHEFLPESLQGSWAPSSGLCDSGDKALVSVSAKDYVSADAKCTVMWVSETAGNNGPIYAAQLMCSKLEGKEQAAPSNLIFVPTKDPDQIAIGASFRTLKDHQRCPSRR